MQNQQTKCITAIQMAERLAKSAGFKLGYTDKVNNAKFKEFEHVGVSWDYERGRAFAVYNFSKKYPKATWRNGVAAKTVCIRLAEAISCKAVI